MNELNASRFSVGLHTAVAIIAGYIPTMLGTDLAMAAGIVLLIVTGMVAKKMANRKETKWWLSNGLALYLLVWFVAGIYFYNTGLLA
ncbi:MAG: hypothetical protein HY518_02495 [Candidatus Aenigmarchaeota archaeon]|nr:hypothetical protein [Candidatus Aenigmarchaeota archaeon]